MTNESNFRDIKDSLSKIGPYILNQKMTKTPQIFLKKRLYGLAMTEGLLDKE